MRSNKEPVGAVGACNLWSSAVIASISSWIFFCLVATSSGVCVGCSLVLPRTVVVGTNGTSSCPAPNPAISLSISAFLASFCLSVLIADLANATTGLLLADNVSSPCIFTWFGSSPLSIALCTSCLYRSKLLVIVGSLIVLVWMSKDFCAFCLSSSVTSFSFCNLCLCAEISSTPPAPPVARVVVLQVVAFPFCMANASLDASLAILSCAFTKSPLVFNN